MAIGILLWQLQQDFAARVQAARLDTERHSQHLAQALELDLELRALAIRTVLKDADVAAQDPQQLLLTLFPTLTDVELLPDDSPWPDDTPDSHHYYLDQDGQVLLRLAAAAPQQGDWLLHFQPQTVQHWLATAGRAPLPWLLKDSASNQVLVQRHPRDTADNADAIDIRLQNTNWTLQSAFDRAEAVHQALWAMAPKLALIAVCVLLGFLGLLLLLRRLRRLENAHRELLRALLNGGSILHTIEERVLVSGLDGRIRYANPQATRLLGGGQPLEGRQLQELVPEIEPLLAAENAGAGLVSINNGGIERQYSVARRPLKDIQHPGYAWVLRDVTSEQQSMQRLQEARRRYQDIFEGSSLALSVLDFSRLPAFLASEQIRNESELRDWLKNNPERHAELLGCIGFRDTNQVGMQLFQCENLDQLRKLFLRNLPMRTDDLRFILVRAVLQGGGQIESEVRVRLQDGSPRYLWLVLNMPESVDEYGAVALSANDITVRKEAQLALAEREQFWSQILSAMPDNLYVLDVKRRALLFGNHNIGKQLGYRGDQLRKLGPNFWYRLEHPDDSDYSSRLKNLQQVIPEGRTLEFLARWRHANGSWRWFSVREQALSRDKAGRVERLVGIAKDVTEQIQASESLRESERRHRLLAESISDVIYTTNTRLKINYVSSSSMAVLGYNADWLMTQDVRRLATSRSQLGPITDALRQIRSASRDPQRLQALDQQISSQVFIFECLRADDRVIPIEVRLTLMWDDHGHFEGVLGVLRDISHQRRAEKDLRMAATVFEHSTAAIAVTDPAGYLVQVNEAFVRVTGYPAEEVLDQLPAMLAADQQQANQLGYILKLLTQNNSWEGEIWLKRRNGEAYPAWVGITAVRDHDGDLVSYVCFFSDISERKASEQRIHRLAYYDPLTQLPNRTLFQDRLHTNLQQAERDGGWLALMFLDLDRFKPINDSLGHAAGDRMLKEVALRLSECVDSEDTVARMGGDEFTLLLSARDSRDAALNRAIRVGEQILSSLATPFVLQGREFFVTASIGIALSPQDGSELSQLMKNADTAMYHAKERGKNNFQFYQAEMNARALERLELESDLRHALEQGQFTLHYQPQFASKDLRLTGAEALLRWQHPSRGLVPPSEFIPVLEEIGLVVQVGDWVLEEAARQIRSWQQAGMPLPKISVNLSARQFAEGNLEQRVAQILQRSGIEPASLELELTESILMQDVSEALRLLNGFQRLGVSVAIDDFGTGYSSLNYLKQFPIDILKIDRSFVDGLPAGEQDGQIARAIIAMAHSLNLAVIAEGVETDAQLAFLREYGCNEVQGYLLGRPLAAHDFALRFLPSP